MRYESVQQRVCQRSRIRSKGGSGSPFRCAVKRTDPYRQAGPARSHGTVFLAEQTVVNYRIGPVRRDGLLQYIYDQLHYHHPDAHPGESGVADVFLEHTVERLCVSPAARAVY